MRLLLQQPLLNFQHHCGECAVCLAVSVAQFSIGGSFLRGAVEQDGDCLLYTSGVTGAGQLKVHTAVGFEPGSFNPQYSALR